MRNRASHLEGRKTGGVGDRAATISPSPIFNLRRVGGIDGYFIAEPHAPAPHLANPEICAALRMVLVTMPRVSHSCDVSRSCEVEGNDRKDTDPQ